MHLLITTGIYPPDHGGPARFVPCLASAAVALGWDVEVVTLSNVDAPCATWDPAGWRIVSLPRGVSKARRLAVVVRALTASLNRADVVFANGLYEEIFLSRRRRKRPWVAKIVGDPVWERAQNARRTTKDIDEFQKAHPTGLAALQRRFLVHALRSADGLVTPSIQLAEMVHAWGLEYPTVIPNGVRSYPLSDTAPIVDVVTVSRLVPWKGLDVLIRACALEGLSLRIVGDGPMRRELETLVSSLSAETLVTFAGAVEESQVRQHVESGKIFALNSSYEGMSFALLEARERGRPVVVGSSRGNREVERDGVDGLVVDPSSVEAVREALFRLTTQQGLARRLGHAGRIDVLRHYSMGRATAATLSILESVVNG